MLPTPDCSSGVSQISLVLLNTIACILIASNSLKGGCAGSYYEWNELGDRQTLHERVTRTLQQTLSLFVTPSSTDLVMNFQLSQFR